MLHGYFGQKQRMRVLAIETSCDETAVAVYDSQRGLLAHQIHSQVALHAAFGGVVPELASRDHVSKLLPLIESTLKGAGIGQEELDGVAYTAGPGLIGALLVGAAVARSYAFARGLPALGVHHLEGHLLAPMLEDEPPQYPFVALLVSGGHTLLAQVEGLGRYQILGSTLDDAAGEAYDKVARYLDLGYPGGPVIDRVSADGDPASIDFPRAMMHEGLDFSFSGLKTAVVNHVRRNPVVRNVDVAASFQAAVVDVLCAKTLKAAQQVGARGVVLGGGVAANSLLRSEMQRRGAEAGLKVALPSRAMCTDNAAMIASAAWHRVRSDGPMGLDCGAWPNLKLSEVPRSTAS